MGAFRTVTPLRCALRTMLRFLLSILARISSGEAVSI